MHRDPDRVCGRTAYRYAVGASVMLLTLGVLSPAFAMPLGGDDATHPAPAAVEAATSSAEPAEITALDNEVDTLTQRLFEVERQVARLENRLREVR